MNFDMKKIISKILIISIFFLSSECNPDPEIESHIGHLKINVTFTNAEGRLSPEIGAWALLFGTKAKCSDYYEAKMGYARIDGERILRRYEVSADDQGVILMKNMPAGEYYLTVISKARLRYSEKIITIPLGDTLIVSKHFTNDYKFDHDLEPWDYEMPTE